MMAKGDELNFGQDLSIIFYEVNDANPPPYNQTVFWLNAQYYLKFIKDEKDGRKETLIPGRGKLEAFKTSFNNLKRKIEEKKPLVETDLQFLPPVLPEFKFFLGSNNGDKESAYGSSKSSDIFISSQESSEENHDVKKNSDKSRIPIRSSSNASSSTDNLSSASSSLFSLHQKSGQKNNLIPFCSFKINRDKREVLISEDHSFVLSIKKQEIIQQLKTDNKTKKCDKFEPNQYEKYKDLKFFIKEHNIKDEKSRINSAISFPGSVRISKLTNAEISQLELQLGEQKPKILGARK
jgi:hypothetical protein